MKKELIKELLEQHQQQPMKRIEVIPSPEMIAQRENILQSASHFLDSNMLGYCLYDPFRQEFTACHINHEAMDLDGTILCQSPIGLLRLLEKIPYPQRQYIRVVEEQGYRAMMYQFQNGIKDYRLMAVVRLATKNGHLAAFVVEAQVTIRDANGCPWLMLVTLRRAKHFEGQRAEFYELFSILPLPENTIAGMPLCTLRLKLTKQQLALVLLASRGLSCYTISDELHICKNTYKRHCEDIRESLSINDLSMVFSFLKS